jgi:hypothetical protein
MMMKTKTKCQKDKKQEATLLQREEMHPHKIEHNKAKMELNKAWAPLKQSHKSKLFPVQPPFYDSDCMSDLSLFADPYDHYKQRQPTMQKIEDDDNISVSSSVSEAFKHNTQQQNKKQKLKRLFTRSRNNTKTTLSNVTENYGIMNQYLVGTCFLLLVCFIVVLLVQISFLRRSNNSYLRMIEKKMNSV